MEGPGLCFLGFPTSRAEGPHTSMTSKATSWWEDRWEVVDWEKRDPNGNASYKVDKAGAGPTLFFCSPVQRDS